MAAGLLLPTTMAISQLAADRGAFVSRTTTESTLSQPSCFRISASTREVSLSFGKITFDIIKYEMPVVGRPQRNNSKSRIDHYYTQGWKAINSHWDMPCRLDAAFPADRPARRKRSGQRCNLPDPLLPARTRRACEQVADGKRAPFRWRTTASGRLALLSHRADAEFNRTANPGLSQRSRTKTGDFDLEQQIMITSFCAFSSSLR